MTVVGEQTFTVKMDRASALQLSNAILDTVLPKVA
jgi:hypothetical protein